MSWTRDQIVALAPDSASVAASQKLTATSKWPLLEYNERAIWGHCQGSGKNPYLTRIDTSDIAFKCSCPSRKFPCKHGLALLTLFAENQAAFSSIGDCPDWVEEWLNSRASRAEKKTTAEAKSVDKAAQEKRQQKRENYVGQGITDLQQWMQDAIRTGFSTLANKPFSYWNDIAARLVDAQAPGLANRINDLSGIVASGRNVMPRLTQAFAETHLLTEAFARIDLLPAALQSDVRQLIGWPVARDTLLSGVPVQDHWIVLGTHLALDDKLLTHTIWLYGNNTQQSACIVEFAHPSQRASLSIGMRPCTCIDGEVYFYPSATPRRAILGEHMVKDISLVPAHLISLCEGLKQFQEQLQLNPWCRSHHFCVRDVLFALVDGELKIADSANPEYFIPVESKQSDQWRILALAGGMSVGAAVEWNGESILPVGLWIENNYFTVLRSQNG